MFDPIRDHTIPHSQDPVSSYWYHTDNIIKTEPLNKNIQVDVAVVGSGYTGLNCALRLKQLGIKSVAVLEANQIGWGCSSRNAGFVLPGTGRLSYSELVQRFGKESALSIHENYLQATDYLKEIATNHNIDATEAGYIKLAHSKNWYKKLVSSANYLKNEFNYEVDEISLSELNRCYVSHKKAYGALRYQNGFGINPLKLVNVYANQNLAVGTNLYSETPVLSMTKLSNGHQLNTPNGNVTADRVVLASNGYTTKNLNQSLASSILPVLTSVIVTRPLTPSELEASNFKTHQVMMDTRELKYYYRLLPDNRILFGGRSAVTGKAADEPKYKLRLLTELKNSFTGLNELTIDYDWTGWISVSLDQMPHMHGSKDNIYYSTGYCGSGVSYAAFAGRQLAEMIVNGATTNPFCSPLPKFPMPTFRRLGQTMFYQYGRLKDRLG